jgi:branched-chain amino acid transport system ATP-binding protein
LLRLENLVSRYGRVEALHGVSLEVQAGEIVTLVGSNGAGKTTLLRVVSGVQPLASGSITFEGQRITRLPAHRRVQLGIVQVPEGRQVFAPLSVEDNLKLGAWSRNSTATVSTMRDVYDMFPVLHEKRTLAAGALSGGQQQMLAIGRALMAKPKMMLLDEPSMGLAPVLVQQILAAIAQLRKQGVTILLVEQNAAAALAIADRGYVLETGRIVLAESASVLAQDEAVRKAYLGL